MSTAHLTLYVDLGNTCLKWCTDLVDSEQTARSAPHHQAITSAWLDSLWGTAPVPDTVFLASVAAPTLSATLLKWLQNHWPEASVHCLETPPEAGGLTNGYRTFSQLGIDRWLGMYAIWEERSGRPFALLSAGTALTLDVVSADGRHQGGFILPGLQTALSSLTRAAYGCAVNELRPHTGCTGTSLGFDTDSCIREGQLFALKSWLNSLPDALTRWTGEAKLSLWITGGDANILMDFAPQGAQMAPNLVLKGMKAWVNTEISGKILASERVAP